MIDESFLQKVEALVLAGHLQPIVTLPDGTEYSRIPLHRINRNPVAPENKPEPKVLSIGSLDSLITYINENPDLLEREQLIVHVASPTEVLLLGALVADTRQRYQYLKASIVPSAHALGDGFTRSAAVGGIASNFGFTQWLDPETFIIGLQALFADTDHRTDLIKLMSNVGSSAEIRVADDGVGQTTTAKVGTVRVAEVEVPNPVSLAPYRTFREVEQPSSLFIFRVRADTQTGMRAALFEADGGGWREEAVESIKQYIAAGLEAPLIVIG